MNAQQSLLKVKLAANQQRFSRQDFLQKLPEHLSRYLVTCPFIQSPQLDELVPMFWIRPDGTGEENCKPIGYAYSEFSWEKELFEAGRSVGAQHDQQEALFYPFGSNPLYRVKLGWVRENLNELFGFSPDNMGVVSTDLQVGIVLSHYGGYLHHDPNPNEIVFELATWGY